MKAFAKDASIYTNPEWFVAKITDVGDKTEDIGNYPCSWILYDFDNQMQAIDEENFTGIYGDWNIDLNPAYPISQLLPSIGDVVLMRFRGTRDSIVNVFEFISGGKNFPELALTAIQCSGDILTKTFSTGCVYQ